MNITAYQIAERFIGTKEIPGNVDNPAVLSWLKLDGDWPQHDEVPWCSAFTNYVAWLLRLPRSKSLAARSWLGVGTPIDIQDARVGFDVVILKRDPNPASGHVGFFAGVEGGKVLLLGGNQGNRVCVSDYDYNRVIGVRRLADG